MRSCCHLSNLSTSLGSLSRGEEELKRGGLIIGMNENRSQGWNWKFNVKGVTWVGRAGRDMERRYRPDFSCLNFGRPRLRTILMSSTYAHYQQPSSLPADYAILSRLNSHPEPESVEEEEGSSGFSTPRRRESFPQAEYYRPHNPTIGHYPVDRTRRVDNGSFRLPSETTPLLSNPPVPRIEENNPSADNESKISMFWEEMLILAKYSFPIFG